MKSKLIVAACAGALAAAFAAQAQDTYTYRIGRANDWNVAAADGACHLRIWVDDKATVKLRGDQIIVDTRSGKRSFDQGSTCSQPLPFHPVGNFRVTTAQGRGTVMEVREPNRRNDFTGELTIVDPQNGGDSYDVVVAWNNGNVRVAPVAAGEPYPYYDETRACQERVRREFLTRNDVDAYLEFNGVASRDEMAGERERIFGNAWVRNRDDSRPITYECVVNLRTSRVMTATYDVRGPARYSSLY